MVIIYERQILIDMNYCVPMYPQTINVLSSTDVCIWTGAIVHAWYIPQAMSSEYFF